MGQSRRHLVDAQDQKPAQERLHHGGEDRRDLQEIRAVIGSERSRRDFGLSSFEAMRISSVIDMFYQFCLALAERIKLNETTVVLNVVLNADVY